MASALQKQLLEGIGNDVVNELVYSLGSHFGSGDLANSISYEITKDGRILIRMLPHWKYVEYGTPGTLTGQTSTVDGKTVSFGPNTNRKMPFKKDGDQFINLITNRPGDFALAKFIQLHGTRPYPFVRPVLYHKLKAIVARNKARHMRA